MNRIQKMAWWIVGWISVAMIIALVAVAIGYKAINGCGFLGISGLAGLAPLIFRKGKGRVTCDERDILINRRAVIAGFVSSYLVTGLTCMLPFFILGSQASISVVWLPNIFLVVGVVSFFIHSVAILVQYGLENKNDE